MKCFRIPAAVVLTVLLACSKEPTNLPAPERVNTGSDSSGYKGQKVLLQFFTGVDCGYCPQGKVEIKDLEQRFPEAILPMSLFTYSGKLSSAVAEEFQKHMGGSGFPTLSYGFDTYDQLLAHYEDEPKASLSEAQISTSSTGVLQVEVGFKILKEISSQLSMNVYLLEDSIVAAGPLKQYDYQGLLEDRNDTSFWRKDVYSDSTGHLLFKKNTVYMHSNVLMASSINNNLWGKNFNRNQYSENEELRAEFELVLKNLESPYKVLAILWQKDNRQLNHWTMVCGGFVE